MIQKWYLLGYSDWRNAIGLFFAFHYSVSSIVSLQMAMMIAKALALKGEANTVTDFVDDAEGLDQIDVCIPRRN